MCLFCSDCSVTASVFHSLASSDVESPLLTYHCRFLESSFQTDFTSEILASSDYVSHSYLKKEILQLDLSQPIADASAHPSQKRVAAVASSTDGSWLKLWDVGSNCGILL